MTVSCGTGMMMYLLPMMLGRTYDAQTSSVGIDIYNQDDIDNAMKNPHDMQSMSSSYRTIEGMSEKRDFLGISGEFALKASAGLLNVKGSYLKDMSNYENKVEILIKTTFISKEVVLETEPLSFWETMPKEAVGTDVVTSLQFGGELIASVNFIARKEGYLRNITGEINGAIAKEGAFSGEAQGKLESLAKKISSKAKMEIDYYATVPLEKVPNTIEGLKKLVNSFNDQVKKINKGMGVAVCAGLRPLSDFPGDFSFKKNEALMTSLEDFTVLFDDLRQAKLLLKSFVSSLPQNVSDDYFQQVANFSDRLTSTLMKFHKVIGNMDLEKGPEQLNSAQSAYKVNTNFSGMKPYTVEIKKLMEKMEEKDDPNEPRGIYTRWGKRSCGTKTKDILYIGFMSSYTEKGAGSGTEYQCLPENPDLNLDFDATGSIGDESTLAAVRYKSLSVFEQQGEKIENKVASCAVCETAMRPTVQMFPASTECPVDWVEEYSGFMVTSNRTRGKAEFVCLDNDPDSYSLGSETNRYEPVILPVSGKKSKFFQNDSTLPCVVCSK